MTDLPTRKLGRTGLKVTMLGYGDWNCAVHRTADDRRAGGDHPERRARRQHHCIDTSIDYGVNTQRIVRYVSHRRSSIISRANAAAWWAHRRLRGRQVDP
jgi:aryl-alcohol dehydrogenase-like predicted oxidoreductase